jgi:hypothetical protein
MDENKMDQRIYGSAYPGIYLARRIPKGGGNEYGGAGAGAGPAGAISPGLSPTPIVFGFGTGQVPTLGVITRYATYTVPPNRKAIIQTAFARALRRVVAGAAGEWAIYIMATRKGASTILAPAAGNQDIVFLWQNSNVGGFSDKVAVTGAIELEEGDTLFAEAYDQSNGGTIAAAATAWVVEFDASMHPSAAQMAALSWGNAVQIGTPIPAAAPLPASSYPLLGAGPAPAIASLKGF